MNCKTFGPLLPLCLLLLGCKETPTKGQEAPPPAPSALAPAAPAPPAKPVPKRPTEPQNVIFLTVDALRADMPWAGYDKAIAPNLTELAQEAVVYENHRSVSSYTAQTVATWLSGRYASTLYRTGMFFTNYFDSNEWITEALQERGIATMAVHAHLYFDRSPGLRQGFDVWKMVPGLTWNAQTDESITGEKSAAAIIELLSDPVRTKGQFFLWSHLMDPHDVYVKHEEAPDFGKDNRGRYDSEVWFTDRQIGKILAFAKTQPWWERTVVMVSADHGEAFGEHGMYKHAFELWEVLTRVPLLVRAPGAAPQRIAAARTHLDIAPTILDLMGVPPLPGFQGHSLAPEIYGTVPPAARERIILELAEDSNNPPRRAIVAQGHKLITFELGKKMLFDLEQDPGETKDLSKEQPERVKAMSAELDAYFARLPVIAPFGGNKLRSGKVATGPKGPAPPAKAP
jgi:choline-sulfatase